MDPLRKPKLREDEVAHLLHISKEALASLVRKHELPPPDHERFWRSEDVRAYLYRKTASRQTLAVPHGAPPQPQRLGPLGGGGMGRE